MAHHFELLKREFQSRPFLIADAALREVTLASRNEALARSNVLPGFFQSCVTMNLLQALENFSKLKPIGKKDRTFTVAEIAKITGVVYTVADHWFDKGVLTADGEGSTKKERKTSWRTAFIAGMVGSLRRQGLDLETIGKAAQLIRSVGVSEAKATAWQQKPEIDLRQSLTPGSQTLPRTSGPRAH